MYYNARAPYVLEAEYAELEALFANATTYPPIPVTEGEGGGGRCIDQVGEIDVEIFLRLSSHPRNCPSYLDGETGEIHRGIPRHEHQHNTYVDIRAFLLRW